MIELIESTAARAGIARRARSPTRRSSSAASTRSSTKARGSSPTARRQRASDIDVSTRTATGFPSWRGGPMFYADRVGLATCLRPDPRVPSRTRRALAAGAAARGAGARGRDLPRAAIASEAVNDRCEPPDDGAQLQRRHLRPPMHAADDPAVRDGADGAAVYMRARRIRWARIRGETHRSARALGRAGARPRRSWPSVTPPARWRRAHVRATRSARVRRSPQALLDRGLSADRPVVILSGNSIEHALLALAAMYVGVPYAPIAPAYSLLAREYTHARDRSSTRMRPGLVFAADGARFRAALAASLPAGVELVIVSARRRTRCARRRSMTLDGDARRRRGRRRARGGRTATRSRRSSSPRARPARRRASSTRSGCSARTRRCCAPCWRSWPTSRRCSATGCPGTTPSAATTTSASSLYNGGTLYIDDGKPTPDGFRDDAAQPARDRHAPRTSTCRAATTCWCRTLRARRGASRRTSSAGCKMLFYAAAGLRQEFCGRARSASARRGAAAKSIPFVTGLGATETRAVRALCAGDAALHRRSHRRAGAGRRAEAGAGRRQDRGTRCAARTSRRDTGATRSSPQAAFDEEGFYRLGDALGFVDPEDPRRDSSFEGRLSEDFKLSTGTWVRVGPLRARTAGALGGRLVQTSSSPGTIGTTWSALIFPNRPVPRCWRPRRTRSDVLRHPVVPQASRTLAREPPGSSTAVRRARSC